MDRNEASRLIEALKKGTVTVTFQKIDSDEVRVMPSTLNPIVLKANGVKAVIENVNPDSAWRSFRVETVLGWEIL